MPDNTALFTPAELVVRRILHPDGRIGSLQCGRVVSDDDRGLLIWVPKGAPTMRRVALDGTTTRHLPWTVELQTPTLLAAATWEPFGTLMLMPPGRRHSVWWSFTDTGDFHGWYVNLETPIVRWFGGFDTHDQALDILISPDRRWCWKDEDELVTQIGEPKFWDEAEADAIRKEGRHVIKLAESRSFPFDGTWCDWLVGHGADIAQSPIALPWWWDVPAYSADTGP